MNSSKNVEIDHRLPLLKSNIMWLVLVVSLLRATKSKPMKCVSLFENINKITKKEHPLSFIKIHTYLFITFILLTFDTIISFSGRFVI